MDKLNLRKTSERDVNIDNLLTVTRFLAWNNRERYFHKDVYIPLKAPQSNSMRTDNANVTRYSHAIAQHARNNCALLGPSTEDLSEVREMCVI